MSSDDTYGNEPYIDDSLNEEYQRDLKSSASSSIPVDYFDKNNTLTYLYNLDIIVIIFDYFM